MGRLEVEAEFLSQGVLTEWASDNLLGLDVADEAHAQALANAPAEGCVDGRPGEGPPQMQAQQSSPNLPPGTDPPRRGPME